MSPINCRKYVLMSMIHGMGTERYMVSLCVGIESDARNGSGIYRVTCYCMP